MTAAGIKGKKRTGGMPTQALPRQGSKPRQLYDLLSANRGLPVEVDRSKLTSTAVVYLTDFYGMDIRRLCNGSSRTNRKSKYVLAGEWFGKVYIDYIAERMERAA